MRLPSFDQLVQQGLIRRVSPYYHPTLPHNPKRSRKGRRRVSRAAFEVLESWFQSQSKRPYPSKEEKEKLALESGLTSQQVGNWFTNYRRRKWNKDSAVLEDEVEDGEIKKKISEGVVVTRIRKSLPKLAKSVLLNWLQQNVDAPYPTELQKEQLARECGLSFSQVSNWMVNARRRYLPRLRRGQCSFSPYKPRSLEIPPPAERMNSLIASSPLTWSSAPSPVLSPWVHHSSS